MRSRARGAQLTAGDSRKPGRCIDSCRRRPALFPEIYDLACALAAHGAPDEAADLFHRIAQVDGDFRDVAHRLVRADHVADRRRRARRCRRRSDAISCSSRSAAARWATSISAAIPLINRILALKAIDLAIGLRQCGAASTAESFLREAAIAGSLSHPNIVTIFDVGETDGLAYIAMEYVRGHHLSEFAAAGSAATGRHGARLARARRGRARLRASAQRRSQGYKAGQYYV